MADMSNVMLADIAICMKAKRDFSEKDTLVFAAHLLKTCSKFHNMTMMKIRA